MVTTEQPKRRRTRGPQHRLTPAQERDIIDTYANTDASLHTYAREHGFNATYPYRVLDKFKITWRRGHGETFAEWRALHPEITLPGEVDTRSVDQKLEAIIAESAPEPQPIPDVIDATGPLELWDITITEHFAVSGHAIEGALAMARKLRPEARITAIALKEHA